MNVWETNSFIFYYFKKKLFWMLHLNLNTNEHYRANSADEIKERKENKL